MEIQMKYLINIKNSGDEKIQDLYERLYFNCELELSNTLPRPNPKLNMILYKKPRENKQEVFRSTQNNINNIPQNRFKQKTPQTEMERPQTQNQFNQMSRPKPPMVNQNPQFNAPHNTFNPPRPQFNAPHPQFNAPHPQFNAPHPQFTAPHPQFTAPHPPSVNPNFRNNQPPHVEKEVQNQPQAFNFGGDRIKPPSMIKTPIIKPPRPGGMDNNINNNFNRMGNKHPNEMPFTNQKKQEEIVPKEENVIKSEPLNQDEEAVYNYFQNSIEIYNSVYKDENKRKDFANKVNALLKKLESHGIKNSLIKNLQEFINLKNSKNMNGMKRLYMRIQSIDWDKNKNWMPCLEKIMNMRD